MGEIIIKHRAGGETKLQNKQATVKITRAEQRKQLLGEDVLTITTKSAEPIAFEIGDYIDIFGSIYTINQLPTIERTGTRLFEQTIILEGTQYELLDVQFILPGNTMYDNLTGDLNDFIDVLIQNANRIYPGKWTKGVVPENTEVKTLSFSEKNCLEALQTLCEEYSTEFEIVVSTTGTRTLHIKQVGLQFPFPFTYGRTGGLYQLTRQNVNSQSVVTRLYVYGGSSNLGSSYRYSKLCLPGKLKNDSYIEDVNAVTLYGVKENTKTFDKIYPKRVGEVSALGDGVRHFIDNTMNFDLNELEEDGETTKWLINGVKPKIKFTSGGLAGYEFECSYKHETKTITIDTFTDENGMKFPSETNAAFQFKKDDKYIFTDINLPDSYITDAEAKLETEGEKHYNKYSQPQVQYSLAIHPRFLEKYAGAPEVIPNIFALGDQIQVIDDDIGVNKSLRITGFTRDALDPYRYTLTLSEAAYSKTIINRIISDIKDITDIIEINNLADPSKARRNWRASQEVLAMVFDPEGKYYSEKIRPLSIETSMLAVGARSQQFTLQNVRFEPNYEGNPNKIMITGGHLIHYTVEDTIRYWEMVQATYSNLVSNTAYYIYARCSKTTAAGSIILATTQRKVDYEEGYYTFMIGVLNSVPDDDDGLRPARLVSLTYGSSTINGRFIKTGRIESSGGGGAYFDLDNGEIGGNIKFVSSDGTEKDVSDLDDVAQETKDYINNTLPGILDEIQGQLDGQIEQFFETYDPTTSNAPANTWTTTQEKENHLGDLFYNTSTGKVFRWVKESGDYKWQELQDSELAQALALANEALVLAKDKNRIFTTTPFTPYEIGDLWVQGASGDIMRCKTTRLTGSYNSYDWEKASQYTSDAGLNSFINGTYNEAINDLTNQIDGKIESWFQTFDPSNAWTTAALKAKHIGDMWYNPSTKLLKRYTFLDSTYSWTTIDDQKAIDAYEAASHAQDTADGKRRSFTEQPTPPYDIGDLWVQGANGDIMRCKTSRATGNYTASDWELASKYTSDASLIDFITGSYANTIADLTNQLDGKIESWFQSFNPASAWTTAALKAKHIGDMWYNPSTRLLQRYTFLDSTYSWTTIDDQKAIDAYEAASHAQDTADGKRRVFVETPYPPYDIGDLWVNGEDLCRCATARQSGSYVANDWVIAVNYDNTVTTINGGIVTSGTVQLAGSGGSILAGITGEGTADTSVRVWAGASKENRATAPFRVLQDGSFVATKATIEGEINATSGKFTGEINAESGSIGGFEIGSERIGATASSTGTSGQGLSLYDDFIKFADSYRWASIGLNVLPAVTGAVGIGRFSNTTPNGLINYGLVVNVSGGAYNLAIVGSGNVVMKGLVTGYEYSIENPAENTVNSPGFSSNVFIVKFTNDNSVIAFPSLNTIVDNLGINATTPFSVRITIICSADSTKEGHIYGRNTSVPGMSSSQFPQRLNNNAEVETGGLAMQKGDIAEFQLVWDGTNYRAYHLTHKD